MMIESASAGGELAAVRTALHGQYDIQRELGRGGMGIVLLARDERLDRPVALKVLPPRLAGDGDTRERFLREARMAAQLSHPNIVPVYRADEIGDCAFFAMAYVEGETLAERIRDRGTLPPAEVVRILREVAWALAYAHARGIVHRDIKPENILLERSSGRAIVTDFGIARADFNPTLTQDGLVLGTVHYMSPEQASGEALDGRSDLYALGCIGFLGLSGRLPFDGTTPQGVLVAHATKEPPLLRTIAPGVSPSLAGVIDRCLRKRPADRFATGEELADALAKAAQEDVRDARDQTSGVLLSGDAAMAVWRRAAELQAEAAARLESRVRANETRALSPLSASDATVDSDNMSAPTSAYRVRDVEAAALEAGISQRFVALALDEMRANPAGAALSPAVSPLTERIATRMFGTAQWSVSASRTYRMTPRDTLQALGRTLQAAPWSLTLEDTLGGHPLDGGTLVFSLPGYTDANYRWSWTRYGVYVPELRVTLAAVPGDSQACEITMSLDLRRGLNVNVAGYGTVSAGLSAVGGVIAGAIAKKALVLTGAAIAGPAVAAGLALGGGLLLGAGAIYRWEMRKAADELRAALNAIDVSIRARDLFGEQPPPPPSLPPGSDAGGFLATVS